MEQLYPARYTDAQGVIATTIANDGATLRMSLDGVEFSGSDFDSLSLAGAGPAAATRFALADGALCDCLLEVEMAVTVECTAVQTPATLHVRIDLGPARPSGGIESETVQLTLVAAELRLTSAGRSGWFEDELAELQRKLPSGWVLRCCFGCGLSDYSPAGHGLFGSLACFRGHAAAYRRVTTKQELFAIWDARTEFVQETHVCASFEPRTPGAGYRG